MKKIYFLTIVFLLFSLALKGQTVLSEDFENGFPSGWTTYDRDGDGENWVHRSSSYTSPSPNICTGSGCVISASYDDGHVYNPDNWLITPEVTLPVSAMISFKVVAQSSSWRNEHWGVYISTDGGTSFIKLIEETSAPAVCTQNAINLSAYAGQNVRIAFRHFECSDQWWLNLDDVIITNILSEVGYITPVDPDVPGTPVIINGSGNPEDPSGCPLQIHLERTLGYSSDTYGVYYTVNDNWAGRTLLELDPATASYDTTLLLPPSTMFELWGNTGGSDFNCRIIDGSGDAYMSSYYPNYKTLDACSPVCNLYVMYGCGDPLLTISEPRWIKIYAGDNNYNPWDYLYQSSWTEVEQTYGTMIPVTAGIPLRFVWTEPDEVNHNSFFVIRDNATNQELFRKNAGEILPNGEFLVYTPNCGSCGASDRCPLTIHLERNANDPNHPGEYILEYFVGGDYSTLHEIHLGPSESSKDTTLMLCPETPFELNTKWESGVGTYGGSDFYAAFGNAYGDVIWDGYAPSYTTEDPCARNCEYALRVGAATNLSNVNSTWFEIFEGNSTTPMRTIGLSSYTGGSTYYWSIPVMAGKTYRFVWHDPDPENHATFFNLRDQDDQIIFEKTSYNVLPDGEFFVVTPTCQAVLITTDPVTNITEYSAKGGGTIRTDAIDSYNVSYGLDYGVCYGTTPNPTVSGAHTTSHSYSSGNFSFTHTMPNLQDNTTYYVRAYVSYMGETTYGEMVQFTTPQAYFCQTPSLVNGYVLSGCSALITWQVQNVTMPIESYTLQYKKASNEDWSAEISVADTQYVLNGLLSSTEYDVRVRSVCESTTSSWKTASFTTPVALMDHLYVTTTGSGDGSSWANALGSLSDALNMAADIQQIYDTTVSIWVAAGTYYGDVSSTSAFTLHEGINVYGGFAGYEPDNYDLSLRDFNANATILDGQNSRRVLYQEGSPIKTTVFDGFTIQNGSMTRQIVGVYWDCIGGGAYLVQAFEMRNCRFIHNYAESYGSAVYIAPTVLNPTFKFLNCEFSYNQSEDESTVDIDANLFYDNNVNVDSLDLDLEFLNCDFLFNNSGAQVVFDYDGLFSYRNCKFKHNSVGSNIIYGGRSFVNCEISNNKSNGQGAALELWRTPLASLLNCNIVNNETDRSANSIYGDGAALANFRGTLTNCVIWGNEVAGLRHNLYRCDNMIVRNCAIEGGFEGNSENSIALESDNYGSEPGLNYPFFASPESGDYRLRSQSAMVDAGVANPELPVQDLAGETRVHGGTVDIGCYEYHGEEYCIAPILMATQDIYGTSATITWQNDNPNEPLYYELSYKQESASNWTIFPEQIHAHHAMLTDLQPQTTYMVRLRAVCDAEHTSSYSSELSFTTSCNNGHMNATVKKGTNDNDYIYSGIPFTENFSYSQQIFLAEEINSVGTIDTLWFQHHKTTQQVARTLNIYMTHTMKSKFEHGDDWIPFNQLSLVYSGGIAFECAEDSTWIPIPLQFPFDYNGQNNLVLVVDDNTGSYNSSITRYYGFRGHRTAENRSICVESWREDIDPTNLTTSYDVGDICANVRLTGACSAGVCDRASVSVVAVTDSSATLVFTQGMNTTDCEMEYCEVGYAYMALPTTSSPYILRNLKQNTEYEVRIRSKCGSDYGAWKTVLFRSGVSRLSKIYVTTTGTGNGSSWGKACNDIQWAMETAKLIKERFGTATDVWVAAGTYYGNTELADAFIMVEGVNVYGGFVGDEPENYDLSYRDFYLHPTVLDGQYSRRVLNQRESFTSRTTWDGFTIQRGYVDQYYEEGAGACLRGTVNLYNCIFSDNFNMSSGGYGGGLYCSGQYYSYAPDSMFVRNCVFRDNSVSLGSGGGAYMTDHVMVENCLFENNVAKTSAGGLYIERSSSICNSTIRYNTTQDGDAGGVYLGNSSSLLNCEIIYNRAGDKGGGVYDHSGSKNENYGLGIVNCLVANNTAKTGAGLYSSSVNRMCNTTIVRNEIVSEDDENLGAGIYGEPELHNCIIWGNKRNGFVEGVVKEYEYNELVASHVASDDPISGEHNIVLMSEDYANGMFAPHFVHPSTEVGADDVTNDVDWHLLPSSPCINRGDTVVLDSTDLDGNARVQRGVVDLGCYESSYNATVLLSLPDSIVYVKEGGVGTRIGNNWENATGSVQDAVKIAAVNRAKVWVAAGTYYGDDPSSSSAFIMKEGVSVYGGFAGNEPPTYSLAERDFTQHVSILDGQEQQRVLFQSHDFDEADSVVWDGFTIQNGRTFDDGAGVVMRANSHLKNCIVQNNVIDGFGDKWGCGVFAYGYERYTYQNEPMYRNKISYCKIVNNGAEMTSATVYGGGLFAGGTIIEHTEIAHNAASFGGGVSASSKVYNSDARFSNCLIHDNVASNQGGGIGLGSYYSYVDLVNCDIVRNTVKRSNNGGGLYNYSSTLTARNCIFWGNRFNGLEHGTWGNSVNEANNIGGSTTENNLYYCAVEGDYVGTENIMLAPENDRYDGEQLYVRFMNPAQGDFRLHPLSACVDKGSNEAVDADFDFYGNMRVRDSIVDIGCSELSEDCACLPATHLNVSVHCDSVHLEWNRIYRENQWLLSYGEVGEELTTILVDDTTFSLVNLEEGHDYTAYVRSYCNEQKQSEPSASVYFHRPHCPQDPMSCLPVSNLSAEVLFDMAQLTWSRGGGEEQWLLSYAEEGSAPTELMVTDTAYTLTGLIQDHHYTVYVFAVCNDTLVSDTSVWVTFIGQGYTIPDVCPAVTGLTADVSCDVVTLMWNRDEGVNRWIVSYGLTMDNQIMDTVNNNIYVLRDLPLENEYMVTVCALCTDTTAGSPSPILMFRTQCLQPVLYPDLHVTQITNSAPYVRSTMTVTWTVRNDGYGATPPGGTWNDYIWLSGVDGVGGGFWYDVKETLLATVPNLQSLEPGESYTNSTTVTIPEDFVGNYYLFVITNARAIHDIDFSLTGDTVAPDPYTPSIDGNPYPYLSGIIYSDLDITEESGKEADNFYYRVLSILTPPVPDLIVTAIAHPTDVFSGNEIPITWTVLNQGEILADGEWKDDIYLSQDSSLNMNGAILMGSIPYQGRLLPDSSIQRIDTITIPIDFMGDYYVFVHTDQYNTIFESVWEENNRAVAPQAMHVILSPYPDLVVTSIDMPAVVSANEQYVCRYTVTNMGYGPTYVDEWRDAVYLSRDTVLTTQAPMVSLEEHTGRLNPGESYQQEFTLHVPAGIDGEWNLFVKTDANSDVFEYDADDNNVTKYSLQVSPPDLAVVNMVVNPDTAWSGTTVELSYTLKNLSGGVASAPDVEDYRMIDYVYFGTNPTSYENHDVSLIAAYEHHGFRLEVGEMQTFTYPVTIPDGTNGPGYIFVVCNGNRRIFEGDQIDNNVGTSEELTVWLSPWPDIHVTNFTVPQVTYLGCPFTVEYTIRNDGIVDLNNAAVYHAFYFSNSPAYYNPMDEPVVVRDILNLAVGEEITLTANLTMSITEFSVGFYFVHMLVDAGRNVYEYTGENNNYVLSDRYKVENYPLDLAVMAIEGPDTVQWGEMVHYRMKVKNLSDLPSIYIFKDEFYLSNRPGDVVDNSNSDQLLSREHTRPVFAGEEYWEDLWFEVPYGSPTTAYLKGYVRPEDNPDINMSNNMRVKALVVNTVPVPDLSIMDAVVLDEVYSGQPARLAYKVKNVGSVPIEEQSWRDSWLSTSLANYNLKENMTLDQDEYYIDTVEFRIPLPYTGNSVLTLTVNDRNSMYEFNRDNNVVYIPLQVNMHAPGDLIVTDVTSDATVVSGGRLHAQWNIYNVGSNPMSGRDLRTLAYISSDTIFDAGDRLLGSVTSAIDLNIGSSMSQSIDARVSGLSMGEYYLIVKTDVLNAFNETDDSNNSACSVQPFEVTIRPLPFNTDVSDSLVNNEVSDYMLVVGENTNQTVRIHLSSEDSLLGAYNQIYATHNQIGDNLNYNYSTVGQYTGNPSLYIPYTQEGYYGVNVYGFSPANEAQNTILRADILPFILMSVDANHGSNEGVVTVELTGSRFRPDMLVCLRNGSDTIWADTLIYESYYQAFVRFNLAGRETGIYDVCAVNFCEGETVLHDGFTIEDASPYGLGFDLIIPGAPRPNRTVVMMLEYGNIGNEDLHDQVLEITSNGGCPIALSSDEIRLGQKVLRIPLSIEGEPEGLLRPGSYGSIRIYTYTSASLLFSIKPVVE